MQVARLYRQRGSLKASVKEQQQQLARLQFILDNIDADFTVVSSVVRAMVEGSDVLLARCGLPSATHLLAQLESSAPRKVSFSKHLLQPSPTQCLPQHLLSSSAHACRLPRPRRVQVSDRLHVVWQLVQHLCGALVVATQVAAGDAPASQEPLAALARVQQLAGHGLDALENYDLVLARVRQAQLEASAPPSPPHRGGSPSRCAALWACTKVEQHT